MNDAWVLAPWADVLYACDGRWWDAKRPPQGQQAPALWVCQDEPTCARLGLAYVPSRAALGLCREPWVLHQGLNSGYQALNLAYHFGAARVLLLGFDMQKTGGKTHWFGDHPGKLNVPSPYNEFVKRFDAIAADLEQDGVEVVNCSRETALRCFRRSTIDQELQ